MATLQGAVSELVDVIAAVDGINHAPPEPAEQVTAWPAAFTYAVEGTLAEKYPSDMSIVLHNIHIVVIMPMQDYRQMMLTMLPLCEPVYAAILNFRTAKTSNHISTFRGISHTLGPIDWGGPIMFGYDFIITAVKIENTL